MRLSRSVRHRPRTRIDRIRELRGMPDGFTTADLTQYRHKHNEANGENNRDGSDNNHSVNFGHEGPCSDPIITQQRERAIMNMLGTLLLSLGTPMLLAGDEFGNSQNGNNNAYTQDNETTWLDWDWLYSTEQTAELKLFNLTSRLIALRKARDLYNHEDFFTRLSKIGLLKKSRPPCTGSCRTERRRMMRIGRIPRSDRSPCSCSPPTSQACSFWSMGPTRTSDSICPTTSNGK